MNATQRQLIFIAIALVLCSELFPPWAYEYFYVWNHKCPAGYSFITKPPAARAWDEMRQICGSSDVPLELVTTVKDFERQNWQRVILLLLISGALLGLADNRKHIATVASAATMVIGLILLTLYLSGIPFIGY